MNRPLAIEATALSAEPAGNGANGSVERSGFGQEVLPKRRKHPKSRSPIATTLPVDTDGKTFGPDRCFDTTPPDATEGKTSQLCHTAPPTGLPGLRTATDRQCAPTLPTAPEPIPTFRTKDARIKYVVSLMASGQFRRGRTARELQTAWGIPAGTVYGITTEASRIVQCVIDPGEITRTLNENLDGLSELAHECERQGERREAIVARSKIGEFCLQLMKNEGQSGNERRESERDAFKRLVELGWTPPRMLPGLPMPDVEDPSDFTRDAEGSEVSEHKTG
jgi:hypothetical protein